MINICVIGGGASGLVAGIAAAREGARVTILEQKERLGKKILSTGNGRCNLTNEYMETSCFRGDDLSFIESVLKQFGYKDTLRFFEELGVLTKSRNGYVYPRSDQAATIVEALEMELIRLGVVCKVNTSVKSITRNKKGFHIHAVEKIEKETALDRNSNKKSKKKKHIEYIEKETVFHADKLILSTGGKAASVLGSDGSGYAFAKEFGHSIIPVVPALVQLRSEDETFHRLAGIRADATVSLYVDNQLKVSDTGELQLTDYGISGIPVFQVSRYAAMGLYKNQSVKAVLDFLPTYNDKEFLEILLNKREKWLDNSIEEFLSGIFNKKLIPVFLEKMNMKETTLIHDISVKWFEKLVDFCKHYEVSISSTNSFEQAQVCAGGIKTNEINSDSMESVLENDLYMTGELLDVDGICGGYNLQWAWATGMIAGKSAAIN